MKGILLLSVLWFVGVAAGQDTLTFTNKLATFTNLQGQVYRDVQLVRADAYSIIYRETVGGGSVCLTNLPVAFLESLGISSNQITVAKAGADRRAAGDAAYRQSLQSQAAQAALVLSTYIPTNRLDGRPPFVSPRRFISDVPVTLQPLFNYWHQVWTNKPRDEIPRPLADWKVVTGPIVEKRRGGWVIEAVVFHSPWSHTLSVAKAKPIWVFLQHPPAADTFPFTDPRYYDDIAGRGQAERLAARVFGLIPYLTFANGDTYYDGPVTTYAKDFAQYGNVKVFARETGYKTQDGLRVFDTGLLR